jgi:hypothetical protein
MVGFYQVMWFVMLKFTNHQILGVDTPGQLVPPRVEHGMACLLIRNVVGCESCSAVWGKTHVIVGGHKMHIFTTNIPTFHARYRR